MEENQVNTLWFKVSHLNLAKVSAQVQLAFLVVRGVIEERS